MFSKNKQGRLLEIAFRMTERLRRTFLHPLTAYNE